MNATNTLQVLTQTTTSNIANIADEQTALHKTLRENIDAQATSTHAAEQYQQAMEQQVGRVGAASQQVAETLTAVRAGQTALLETIEAKNEELANQLQALSTAQQSVQAGIDSLEHRANGTMAEVSAIGDGQASAKEMLHAHAEAVNSQMASLAAKGEQIDDGLARLHELAEAIAGTAAGIASEQGSQHRSEQYKFQQ